MPCRHGQMLWRQYLLGSMVTTGDHCGERRRHRAMPCLAARQVCQTEHTGAITKTWQGAPLQKPGSSVSNMLSYHSLIRCWTTVIGIACPTAGVLHGEWQSATCKVSYRASLQQLCIRMVSIRGMAVNTEASQLTACTVRVEHGATITAGHYANVAYKSIRADHVE